MKNFKIDVFLKKPLGSISGKVLLSEKRYFWRFISQEMQETARFFAPFSYILVCMVAYLTPSTTTTCPGTPPTNSQRTKQFFSSPHSLYLFLSEGVELLTKATA
jgi:hypothetical protein